MAAFATTFSVESYLHGCRVDSFLAKHLRNYTTWRLQRLVAAGCVRVNDQVVALACRVRRTDQVSVRLVEPPDKLIDPEPGPLRIVFEDPWLAVIDKPANLVAHPVSSLQHGTLANRLQAHLDSQTPVRGLLRPGIVHRLDRMTSGLVATAKDHFAHRRLSVEFQKGCVAKTYLAVVHGSLARDQDTIDLPIGQQHNSILMTCEPGARRYRPAVTAYQVLDRRADRTLVEVRPKTGRIHQIRVHFAAIGHPLMGDEFYGNDEPQGISPGCSRHALHAASLRFEHPVLQEPVCFRSELPEDLVRLWHAPADCVSVPSPVDEASSD